MLYLTCVICGYRHAFRKPDFHISELKIHLLRHKDRITKFKKEYEKNNFADVNTITDKITQSYYKLTKGRNRCRKDAVREKMVVRYE